MNSMAPSVGAPASDPDESGVWAMERAWDVAVIGAGPAGALAARQLARAGLAVVLIERARFPRDKVCGCCINAAALHTLAEAGLGDLPERMGAEPIRSLNLASGRARASVPIGGVAVSRAAFDQRLALEASNAGATLLMQTVAAVDASGRLLVRSVGQIEWRSLAARVVLAADGLAGSALAGRADLASLAARGSRIGAAAILPASVPGFEHGTIHMTVGAGGYVGAVRLEDRRLNIAAALDPEFIRESGGPGAAIAEILRSAGAPPIAALSMARFSATPMLTRRRAAVAAPGVLILGDAAGYVEPFTGEGIAWALASAVAVAPVVRSMLSARTGQSGASPLADSWTLTHRDRIAPRQQLCRALAWTLRRPRLAAMAIRMVGAVPGAAGPALRGVSRPYAIAEAAS